MTPNDYIVENNAKRPAPDPATVPPQPEHPQAASTPPGFLRAAWDVATNGLPVPSWARGLVAAGAAILVGCGIAMAGSALSAFLGAGAVAMGFGGFLQWLVTICAWAVSIYYGGRLALWAIGYVVTGHIDRDLATARNTVAHAFSVPPKYVIPVVSVPQSN